MPKFLVRAEGEVWRTLAQDLERMVAITSGPEVNMNDLGRALASIVGSVRAAFVSAGLPSVRMDAAAKALDLRTPKSALESFAGR